MPAQITSAFQRFTATIRGFSTGQRTIAIIGIAVLVLGAAALSLWVTKPRYSPLFSGLSATDASAVIEQLRADSIDYELADGGATILVPEADVYNERITAAAAGLPSSDTGGYSLLDDMGVTSSEFQQSVTYQRALEGELAKTVGAMEGIKIASVRLAIPEETVFVSEAVDPTASVFIETKNNAVLSADQVEAIVHLVSASIDGLDPTNVAVIDSRGEVLSAVGTGMTGGLADQANSYETKVAANVQAMLNTVVGAGNATVVVAADINEESAERVEETFVSPEGDPTLSESIDSETYGGAAQGATGVLGPDNIAVPSDTADDGGYSSESTVRNNAINKVTESRTIPAGAVSRQTVSVAIDSESAGDFSVAEIRSLVAAAAGIDADRGDEISVQMVPFSTASATQAAAALAAAEAQATSEGWFATIRTVAIVLGILLLCVLSLFVYSRRRRQREPIEIGELRVIQDDVDRTELTALADPRALESAPGSDDTGSERQRSEIDALAGRDPEKMADYMRSLMEEKQPS